ncbi:hypothetical protein Bca52824_095234 [Brassica carinata]|uniref:Pentatricopeptide repeat-containing protein n=1 Tax=Brassica carinata TaxID=52824 RepID=A0A8X7P2A3_BRACI|nr:hypothetical protein Bca52824_095234 [Brassica carinata]
MICGYMSVGKAKEVWRVFNDMKEKGASPDFKTYSKFINCLGQAGESEDALRLVSEMIDKGIAPSTVNFRTVLYGLNREGKQNLWIHFTASSNLWLSKASTKESDHCFSFSCTLRKNNKTTLVRSV